MLAATAPAGLSFLESRPAGGAWLLDGLWRQLGIIAGLLGSRRRVVDAERVLFALVANRALAPASKLAAAEWVSRCAPAGAGAGQRRCVLPGDAANRRFLQQAGGHYILGEKLPSVSAEATAALARQGRYALVADNLQIKEVNIDADDRFIICCNPEAAERDQQIRARLVTQLGKAIDSSDKLSAAKGPNCAG